MVELLDGHPITGLLFFLIDVFVFLYKATFYALETIYLTLIPDQWRNVKDVSGQTVLITGGGGGVGRLLALNFAKLNARVVVWDINQEALKTTTELLASHGFSCKACVVDISDKELVYKCARELKSQFGSVDILINNAGVVYCKPFWDLSDKDIENTYSINILSHYWTVRAFLPDMMERNNGHIVTVSSVTGIMGTYGCTDYSATKFACNGFHDSLAVELRNHGYDNIEMTLVCPYYINTGMFAGVKPRLIPMLEPEFVADEITKAVQRGTRFCILPNYLRPLTPIKSIWPSKIYSEWIHRVIRLPNSMMLFKGRDKVAAG